ncbi:MAG: hypothetical protein HOK04_00930 [Verrucomicrobia bacterium]|nr:hypothetical protein [Verrucomicrobiota bacterium]
MPGGLGVELLEYARDEHPTIVRMLTTAYSELEDAIAAVNRGEIIRYIEKPWSNIDALLIDLRVAMRFHLLESSNQELMAEKMSAKARGARLDRFQPLAAVAAAQPDSKAALIGLESMLRQLSELRAPDHQDSGEPPAELYAGPVEEAGFAIQLSERLTESISNNEGRKWSDLSDQDIAGNAVNQEIPESLGDQGSELVARGSQVFSSEGGSSVGISVDSSAEGITLEFSSNDENSNLLNRWVNLGSETSSINLVADLLKVFFISFSAGATVLIGLDDKGGLSSLRVVFSSTGDSNMPQQDDDWLEDMLILFA